ncbi:hypothetical protein [Sphaerisporangium aureirubrum]|uniref:Serine protease n=1 Tax=Sphaerisporangium aureirubrum TaxID=1544736 RepID=A0ABW1NLC6_9ACTN
MAVRESRSARLRRLVTRPLVVAVLVLSAAAFPASAGATSPPDPGRSADPAAGGQGDPAAQERAIAQKAAENVPGDKVEAWAQARGALGASVDDAGHYTVTFPATSAKSSLAQLDASDLDVPMTVKRSTLTKADIDATAAKLREFAARHPGHSFGFWYDAGQDATLVGGDLTDELAAELRTFAGKVVVDADPEAGAGRHSCSRYNDCNPHDGGASIESNGIGCTSGVAMVDSSGHDYQVTAGHCFPRGYHLASGPYYYGSVTICTSSTSATAERTSSVCTSATPARTAPACTTRRDTATS